MSTPKKPLSKAEKKLYEKTLLELNTIFPLHELGYLAKFVRQAEGDFDRAFDLVLAAQATESNTPTSSKPTPATRVSISPPRSKTSLTTETTPTVTPTTSSTAAVAKAGFDSLQLLSRKYGELVPAVLGVIGENVCSEEDILRQLEKHKGDAPLAIFALLQLPHHPPEKSPLLSSVEMQSDGIISSNTPSLLFTSTELPANLDLLALDAEDEKSSSNAEPSSSHINPAYSSSSECQSETECTDTSEANDEEEEGEIVYEDDDADIWLANPESMEIMHNMQQYDDDLGVDLLTTMLQVEYDELLAAQLERDVENYHDSSKSDGYRDFYEVEDELRRAKKAAADSKAQLAYHAYYRAMCKKGKKGRRNKPIQQPIITTPHPPPGIVIHDSPASNEVNRVVAAIPSGAANAAAPVPPQAPESYDKDALDAFMAQRLKAGAPSRSNTSLAETIVDDGYYGPVIHSLREIYNAKIAATAHTFTDRPKKDSINQIIKQAAGGDSSNPTSTPVNPVAHPSPSAAVLIDIVNNVASISPSLGPDAVSEFIHSQEQELKSLQTSLPYDAVQISESVPRVIVIAVEEPKYEISKSLGLSSNKGEQNDDTLLAHFQFPNPLSIQLVIFLPPFYPTLSPGISIRSLSSTCPLSSNDIQRLENSLHQTAQTVYSGKHCLLELTNYANEWLTNDNYIRSLAFQTFIKANSPNNPQGNNKGVYRPNSFSSLRLIFHFDRDYSILTIDDIMKQRSQVLKRAILILLNGPSVVHKQIGQSSKLPIYNNEGNVDEEASLRVIGLTTGAVRVIVQRYCWSLPDLSKAYLSSLLHDKYNEFLSDSGVAPIDDRSSMEIMVPKVITQELECPTCLDNFPFHSMFGLVCGHLLCKGCYADYVNFEVSKQGSIVISCPSPDCKYLVDQCSLAGLLNAQSWKQYVNTLVNQYVQTNPNLKWCPSGSGCEHIIQIQEANQKEDDLNSMLTAPATPLTWPNPKSLPIVVQCKCSYTFCSQCSRIGGHFPASCAECDRWDKDHPHMVPHRDHRTDEIASLNFVRSHTKPCPKCHAPIAKAGGCVHMMCLTCKYEFCWGCLGSWASKHYGCSEGKLARPTDDVDPVDDNTSRSFDSLLHQHMFVRYIHIHHIKPKILAAIYRNDKPKLDPFPGNNQKKLSQDNKNITIEDVPMFLGGLDLLSVAHQMITYACKAGAALAAQSISTTVNNVKLKLLIYHTTQDMRFLANAYAAEQYKKNQLAYLQAGITPLKVSLQKIIDHLTAIRKNAFFEIKDLRS